MKHDAEEKKVTRRTFIEMGLAGGAALLFVDRFGFAAPEDKPDVWVFHGEDKGKLMDACLKVVARNGGLGQDVKKLTLKVNAAWIRTPEQGANTHPALVDAFLKGCKDLGIKELVLPEHPCREAKHSFPKSGILDAAKKNGARMIDLASDRELYREVELPHAKTLKKALVGKDFLETDALVNMPVAKHHGGATLTIAMKNWLGAVQDRGFWHRNGLHQCIADFSTFIKPGWSIIDATRIMLDHGPAGPAKRMKHPDLVILSRSQVAADAYASTLFLDKPEEVRYLAIARDMGLGTIDVAEIAVHKTEVR